MIDDDKPLSRLVSQGWEVAGYTSIYDRRSGMMGDNFLLRRMKNHKILKIRRKFFGRGVVVTELDV